jgi:hypothetical protein
MLPDFEGADRIGEFWGYPESRAFAEEKGFPRVRLPRTAAAACGASERSRRGRSAGGAFSPDGATVVYTIEPNVRGGHTQLWTVASDGSREPKLVLEGYGAFTNRRTRQMARGSRSSMAVTTTPIGSAS